MGDGVELAVQIRGAADAPVVLLVHGYPDTHTVWNGVADLLTLRFRVVTYDVRGAGASTRPQGRRPYRFEHLMNDMRAVLDEVSPDAPVHLVGHDWGSIQSWEAVTTMPDRFASFTSISGPCLDHVGKWTRTWSNPRQRIQQSLSSLYIAFFQLPLLPELAWRYGIGAKILARSERALHPHFAPSLKQDAIAGLGLYRANMLQRLLRPKERRTDVPVLAVTPLKDSFVRPPLAETARPHTSDFRVEPINARHWAPVTHAAEIAKLVEAHIDRCRTSGQGRNNTGGA